VRFFGKIKVRSESQIGIVTSDFMRKFFSAAVFLDTGLFRLTGILLFRQRNFEDEFFFEENIA
jgi:hypothetical protein